jgi:hypothetical protein
MFGPVRAQSRRPRQGRHEGEARVRLKAAGKPTTKADGVVDSGLGTGVLDGQRKPRHGQPVGGTRKYAGGGAFALSIFYNVEIGEQHDLGQPPRRAVRHVCAGKRACSRRSWT